MKKIATAAVFAALVTTSIAPAFATSRPKALVVSTDSVATVLPTTLAASTATVVGDPDAFDKYTASKPYVTDPKLYGGLLEYFKADLAFEGALYQALQAKGIDSTALSAAYGKLDQSIANLIAYLQTTVSQA